MNNFSFSIPDLSNVQGLIFTSLGNIVGKYIPSTLNGVVEFEYSNYSAQGKSDASEYKIPLGQKFVNYIHNNALSFTLSSVTIKDVFNVGARLGVDLNNYGIVILELLRQMQKLAPLLFTSAFYAGPVIITDYTVNGDSTTTNYTVDLQAVDIISSFNDLDFDGQIKPVDPSVGKLTVPPIK